MQQRFCPICDRAFQDGEAVLRCEGCSVLHHPGCWVTNGGCATETEHRVTPAALAYAANERSAGSPAPHPGEGTRMNPAAQTAESPPGEPIQFPGRAVPPPAAEPVIGGPPQGGTPMIRRTLPSTVGVPSSAPRRYQPPPGEHMPRRQMPQIYDGRGLLRYWYVPAAIGLALVVAFGVIWTVGKLTGNGGNASPDPTVAATAVGGQPTSAPSAAVTTTAKPASPTAQTGAGKFRGGDAVLVTGAAPDCLNVRVKAGRENDAIVCVADGTELTVTGGPETAGDITWWKVRTELGEGWAAEDYLAKK